MNPLFCHCSVNLIYVASCSAGYNISLAGAGTDSMTSLVPRLPCFFGRRMKLGGLGTRLMRNYNAYSSVPSFLFIQPTLSSNWWSTSLHYRVSVCS